MFDKNMFYLLILFSLFMFAAIVAVTLLYVVAPQTAISIL